jgi:hypothetical protein
LLTRVIDGDSALKGLSPKDYHLRSGERLNEAASRAWNECLAAWKSFRKKFNALPASDAGTTVTRDEWLLPLFQELGYGRLQSKKAIVIDGKEYPISHGWENHVPIHLLSAHLPLDRRTPGVSGAAQRAPYSLLQEQLNRSSQHRWGFVSNGLKLFLLRDNAALARAANVEFDLEAMMDGEHYADFMLMFLLCHQSRVEIAEDGKPEDCWLEKWANQADQQGTRAREKLRDGVETAIKSLGAGFLTTKGNNALRERLRTGELSTQDCYRQLLRVVYRLLMLLVAEEKKTENGENLLHPTDTTPEVRDRYARFYSVSRIRSLAYERRGTAHTDLYESLKVLFLKLREGYAPLGIPGMGSFLFSDDSTPDLDDALLANQDLLDAFRNLCYTEDTSGRGSSYRRPVDFGNLGSEELGSVYESLLELHPQIDTDAGPFSLGTAAGNERKTTGSYYTPTSLINCLLDSALDPVVSKAIDVPDPAEAEQNILDLKVCDPACGSGHFLIAAAERMSMHLARLRTGDDQPNTLDVQHAKRDIIGRCIYGVDVNPMAVELCKVSLWMEALEPGKPLSFLDHHIQCGNSLFGATPRLLDEGIPDDAFKPIEGDDKKVCAELKKDNKKQRKAYEAGYRDLHPLINLGDLPQHFARLTRQISDTVEDTASKAKRYAELVKHTSYENAHLLADYWCATFVWKKVDSDLGKLCPTEREYRRLQSAPSSILPQVREEVQNLGNTYQVFHWHLAFPDVFQPTVNEDFSANELMGWSKGFDVVLGNPPWERIKLQDREWFAERVPEISKARNASERNRLIKQLKSNDVSMYSVFLADKRMADGIGQFVRQSGMYPCCGRGDVNTYALFAELNRSLKCSTGRVGCIIPSGIATDDTTKLFFQSLIETGNLVSLLDFENREAIFIGVHRSYKFALVTMGQTSSPAKFTFFALSVHDLSRTDKQFTLTAKEIELLNPDSKTCPVFRLCQDAEIAKWIYRRVPTLGADFQGIDHGWAVYYMRLIDYSDHSDLLILMDSPISAAEVDDDLCPVYESKLFHGFDHHYAAYATNNDVHVLGNDSKGDPSLSVVPKYYLREDYFTSIMAKYDYQKPWILALREVTANTNERTSICTPLRVGPSFRNTTVTLGFPRNRPSEMLVANFNSYIFDYLARQKLSGNHLSYRLLLQLPTLSPISYRGLFAPAAIVSRVVELCYFAQDLEPFAVDCGYDGPPFRWDEERRFQIRCELDAAYFHLYLGSDEEWGADNPTLREMFPTPRDAVDYIMDTFPIVRRKDEAKYNGEFKTKNTILKIYDEMTEAIRTGQPYQTWLDPPPGPPTADGNFIPLAQWTEDLNTSHIHAPRVSESSTSHPRVVDPVFPGTDLDKILCACLLDFAQAESTLTEEQNLDKVILAMQADLCRNFLSGDDSRWYEESLANVPSGLIADTDSKPPWQLLLSSLMANRSLAKIGDYISPGENFDAVRQSLPEVHDQFLSLVAKAAERFREISEDHETDESTRSVVQEVQQQRALVQTGAED